MESIVDEKCSYEHMIGILRNKSERDIFKNEKVIWSNQFHTKAYFLVGFFFEVDEGFFVIFFMYVFVFVLCFVAFL